MCTGSSAPKSSSQFQEKRGWFTVGTRPRDRNERSRTFIFLKKKTPTLKINKVPSKNGDLHQKRDFGNMSSQLLRSRRYLFSSKRLGRGNRKGRQGTFVETGSTFDTCPDCRGMGTYCYSK